jgi:hypothetical protein
MYTSRRSTGVKRPGTSIERQTQVGFARSRLSAHVERSSAAAIHPTSTGLSSATMVRDTDLLGCNLVLLCAHWSNRPESRTGVANGPGVDCSQRALEDAVRK